MGSGSKFQYDKQSLLHFASKIIGAELQITKLSANSVFYSSIFDEKYSEYH